MGVCQVLRSTSIKDLGDNKKKLATYYYRYIHIYKKKQLGLYQTACATSSGQLHCPTQLELGSEKRVHTTHSSRLAPPCCRSHTAPDNLQHGRYYYGGGRTAPDASASQLRVVLQHMCTSQRDDPCLLPVLKLLLGRRRTAVAAFSVADTTTQ